MLAMTQIPAGWYADPAPGDSGPPPGQRYWDGQQWTGHVSAPFAGQGPLRSHGGSPGPSYGVKTTPDGEPLAGWWSRVGASLLDFVILTPLVVVAAVPVVASQWDSITDYFRRSMRAYETAAPQPPEPEILSASSVPGLVLTLVVLLVSAAYILGFWRWKQATPGKLIVGLRVRRREVAGTMPWSTMLIRFAVVNLLLLTGDSDVAYWAVTALLLVNYLWPLWDDKNQALHDKAARTNVVVHRR